MNDQPAAKARVVIYTRPGCHLCDEAREQIALARCGDLFSLEEIDIDSDAELSRRYGHDIPVVTIDGAHAFKHSLTAEEFKREIQLAAGRK